MFANNTKKKTLAKYQTKQEKLICIILIRNKYKLLQNNIQEKSISKKYGQIKKKWCGKRHKYVKGVFINLQLEKKINEKKIQYSNTHVIILC